MLSNFYALLVDAGTVVGGGEAASTAASNATPAADAAAATGLNPILMIVLWAAVIGLFYFFSIRPQSKREKKLKEMQAGIKAGDNVLTTSGFFGKVSDVGDDCFIVEFGTNRGVRIPVRKSDIVGIHTPNITTKPVAQP
ncbi:MAG: preprotein translocase subunit YajC [Clostridiales bacterium]|jgi:preprotein translocase subunit YajC|nr:preprotein translocase subunit YajC [Clostridiales bacterium]